MEIKCLFGSKMLKLKNNRDEDWITFVEKHNPKGRERGHKRMSFYQDMIDYYVNGKTHSDSLYNSCYIYQLSSGFHNDETYPFKDFNLLEHKAVWIEQLKGYMNLPKTEEDALKGDILPKIFYHILYQYHMLLENTHWISEEAKTDVQKIHDLEMPSSYFYELRDLISGL